MKMRIKRLSALRQHIGDDVSNACGSNVETFFCVELHFFLFNIIRYMKLLVSILNNNYIALLDFGVEHHIDCLSDIEKLSHTKKAYISAFV